MTSDDRAYQRSAEVRYRIVGDRAVVVRQDVAEVMLLNEVGARVLDLLDGNRTLAEIQRLILSEYEVDEDRLEQDVRRFVEELQSAGIIEMIEDR